MWLSIQSNCFSIYVGKLVDSHFPLFSCQKELRWIQVKSIRCSCCCRKQKRLNCVRCCPPLVGGFINLHGSWNMIESHVEILFCFFIAHLLAMTYRYSLQPVHKSEPVHKKEWYSTGYCSIMAHRVTKGFLVRSLVENKNWKWLTSLTNVNIHG